MFFVLNEIGVLFPLVRVEVASVIVDLSLKNVGES